MVRDVEWIFKRLALLVFGPALIFAGLFVYECDWRDASISAGIAATAFTYWIATYTKKDLTR